MAAPTSSLFNGFLGSFQELAVELAQYIDTLKKSPTEDALHSSVEAALKKEDREQALKLLVENASVLNSAPEKNIIPAYNLLLHLVRQSPKPDPYFSQICTQLTSSPISSSQHGPGLSLTVLSTVFNIIPEESASRFHVLSSILAIVRSTSSFDAIRPQLDSLETWLQTWSVPDDKKRSCYLEVSTIAHEAGEHDISYNYLINALKTFTSDSSSSPDARKLALQALKVALERSAHYDFQDLTALDGVQSLRKSDPIYFQLLELFTSDSLEEFNDFKDEHEGWIEAEDLDKQALDRKMRLLTLASLAASSGQARSLPYATIAEALQIPEEDVEVWVIDVIRAGLVEGKLSQLNKTFLIHRSTYRVFGDNQWREIAARLDMWKTSLTGVLRVIKQEKASFVAAKEQEQKEAEAKLNGTQNQGGGGFRNRQQQRPQEVLEVE